MKKLFLPKPETLNKQVRIRLTEKEHRDLEKAAKKHAGGNISRLVRFLIDQMLKDEKQA